MDLRDYKFGSVSMEEYMREQSWRLVNTMNNATRSVLNLSAVRALVLQELALYRAGV